MAAQAGRVRAMLPFEAGIELMGGLPEGVDAEIWDIGGELPPGAKDVQFYVPPFLTGGRAAKIMKELPSLEVVQTLTAGFEDMTDDLPDGVVLCNARGAHDASTAEWVVGAMIGALRDFPRFLAAQAAKHWDPQRFTDVLATKKVLIVGYGSIGAEVEKRLAGFEVEITKVARRARDGVHSTDELPDLLPHADVVVLLVPASDKTRHLVDAEFLSRLHDGALVVNAARGPIVDTDALIAELASQRLRAALDVTDPEPLPDGHSLFDCPNLLLTPHVAGSTPLAGPRAFGLVRRQLERFVAGEPLDNIVAGPGAPPPAD